MCRTVLTLHWFQIYINDKASLVILSFEIRLFF